jgi:hypothetical protein
MAEWIQHQFWRDDSELNLNGNASSLIQAIITWLQDKENITTVFVCVYMYIYVRISKFNMKGLICKDFGITYIPAADV